MYIYKPLGKWILNLYIEPTAQDKYKFYDLSTKINLPRSNNIKNSEYNIESYKINKFLGKGSYGLVFEANYLGSNVALKISPTPCDNEIKILNELRFNKHTLQINTAFISMIPKSSMISKISRQNRETIDYNNDYYILVSELVEGDNLEILLDDIDFDNNKLTPKQKYQIITDCVNSLLFAHNKNIMHRDIKPTNILISKKYEDANTELRAKISDFGLSKYKNSSSINTNTIVGTELYMAPEVKSGQYSFSADVWSFGFVIYQILENKKKIDKDLDLTKLKENKYSCNLDSLLQEILIECIHKNPNDRISMEEISDMLKAVENDPKYYFEQIETKKQNGQNSSVYDVYVPQYQPNYNL